MPLPFLLKKIFLSKFQYYLPTECTCCTFAGFPTSNRLSCVAQEYLTIDTFWLLLSKHFWNEPIPFDISLHLCLISFQNLYPRKVPQKYSMFTVYPSTFTACAADEGADNGRESCLMRKERCVGG